MPYGQRQVEFCVLIIEDEARLAENIARDLRQPETTPAQVVSRRLLVNTGWNFSARTVASSCTGSTAKCPSNRYRAREAQLANRVRVANSKLSKDLTGTDGT